MQSKTGKGR